MVVGAVPGMNCPQGDQMHATDDPEGGPCSSCVEYVEEMRQEWQADQLIGMGLNPDGSVPLCHCEGSDYPAHLKFGLGASGICKTCGQIVRVNGDGIAYDHEREVV